MKREEKDLVAKDGARSMILDLFGKRLNNDLPVIIF